MTRPLPPLPADLQARMDDLHRAHRARVDARKDRTMTHDTTPGTGPEQDAIERVVVDEIARIIDMEIMKEQQLGGADPNGAARSILHMIGDALRTDEAERAALHAIHDNEGTWVLMGSVDCGMEAALNTIAAMPAPPVAVTEADEPLEGYGPYENAVYALVRMREESPLLSLAQDDDIAAEAIYTDALQRKFKGKAEVLAVEMSDNATGAIRDAVRNATEARHD